MRELLAILRPSSSEAARNSLAVALAAVDEVVRRLLNVTATVGGGSGGSRTGAAGGGRSGKVSGADVGSGRQV